MALQSLREQGVHQRSSAGQAAGCPVRRTETRDRELHITQSQAVNAALTIQMDSSCDGPIAEPHAVGAIRQG